MPQPQERHTDLFVQRYEPCAPPLDVRAPVSQVQVMGRKLERTAVPTADGRYVVIDGRRWRATDPSIPEKERRRLVARLMDARRAVKAAKRAGDDAALAVARREVHEAKVALGERGTPWWTGKTRDEDTTS